MAKVMGRERRGYPRIEIRHMVKLMFGKENVVHVLSANICEGGILCTTEEYTEQNAHVYIIMGLPFDDGEHIISSTGTIVRSEKRGDKHQTAVKFIDLDKKSRRELRKFIKSHK